MRIFLVGFMGVGKSTLGKTVADLLALPFYDLDTLIERKHETTISEIFSEYGEALFRKLEHDELLECIARCPDMVLGTGGGLPCHLNNLEIMNDCGLTIYLQADAKDIADRLSSASGMRPLIADKKGVELARFVVDLLSKRHGIYMQSQLVVNLDLSDSKQSNTQRVYLAIEDYLASIKNVP